MQVPFMALPLGLYVFIAPFHEPPDSSGSPANFWRVHGKQPWDMGGTQGSQNISPDSGNIIVSI